MWVGYAIPWLIFFAPYVIVFLIWLWGDQRIARRELPGFEVLIDRHKST
jgi:hypothetical protein